MYSDIILAEAKEAVSNGYKVLGNDGSINVQNYMLGDKKGANGANLTGEESIVHTGTKANQKSAIVKNYTIGARTASQTIGDAIANSIDKDGNINDADVTEILEEVFKGEATSYDETLTNISDALLKEAVGLFGEVDNQAKEDAISTWLYELEQKGYLDFVGGEVIIDKFLSKLDTKSNAKSTYNKFLDYYMSVTAGNMDYAKNIDKKNFDGNNILLQTEIIRQNQEKIKEKIGDELYNTLVEKITEEEEKLKKVLNEKGIDW